MADNTIRVDAIVASKTNPRKHFDKAALQELAESIGKHGILQPILVRPNSADGNYELVAGERRWRAAKIAKLERIPATVRELTDAEVLEIQVVENLQRADLHPLEEAEGYEALMKCQHADGNTYTADEIAAKVGKSRSYVYQRLKLTSLTPKAREAFYAGTIDASRALLVARLPAHQQAAALEAISDGEDDAITFRAARDILQREFMLHLDKPPFDAKAIYFAGTGAQPIGPPCAECPKRTGNQPELFADVKSGDVCTDAACYQAKEAAHTEREAERLRAKGHEVLTGEKARKVMPNTWTFPRGGYVPPDTVLLGAPQRKTIAKLLGKKMPLATMVEHPSGKQGFVPLVKEAEVRRLLAEAGHDWATKDATQPRAARSTRNDDAAGAAQRDLEVAVELAIHKALREAVRRDGLTEADLRVIVGEILLYADRDRQIDDLALSRGDSKRPWRETVDASELQPLLVDAGLGMLEYGPTNDDRRRLAKLHGIDVEAIERQVKAEHQAKQPAEPPKKARRTKAAPAEGAESAA